MRYNLMPESDEFVEAPAEVSKALRVALIASRRTVFDYPLYLKYLLVGLADESIPVLLVCPPDCDVESIVPPAVDIVRHPAFDVPILHPYNIRLLLRRLREFRPDLLHCLCETKAAMTRWLTRRLGVPYIVSIDSVPARWFHMSVSKNRCTAIIAPSETIAERFSAVNPKLASRLQQINFGIFVNGSVACFADVNRLPGILAIQPLDRSSGLDNLFGALRRLAIDGYQFMFALIGTGPAEKQIRKKLASLGLSKIVTIVPNISSPYSSLGAADIFVVPRSSRCFNELLLAAMGRGCVVAAAKGGVDDLIIEDQTALVFDAENQLSIYDCLRRLLDRRDEARQIAAAAQQYLRQNHHVSDMVAAMFQLYRQVARPAQPQTESPAA